MHDSFEEINEPEKINETEKAFLDKILSPIPGEASLPDMLRKRADSNPDGIAAIDETNSLTFNKLVVGSERLARHLRAQGADFNQCIGLFVESSLDLMVGVWGILFSGSAYLPLSPEYPVDRLRYIVDDANVKVVVTQSHLTARLASILPPDAVVVTLDETGGDALPSAQPALAGPRADHLAYVIYTSGSTGKPKGVMIEHRSIVSQMNWLGDEYGFSRDTVILQKTPISFDAAQWEILAPVFGSQVVMSRPGAYRDPENLIDTIFRHRVTTLQCVPTLLQALLETDGFQDCTSLAQVFSGGEALSRRLALQFQQSLPGSDLINLYGPTECTINASALTIERPVAADGTLAMPIGKPVNGTRFYLLDGNYRLVADGEMGELYIGGIQLARGYLNRPDLTADRFIDNPFETGTRLYRTGDLAFTNANGEFQFAARVDNQVKLRGFRVELDEIRLAIEAHDWVKSAAVLIKEDPRTSFQNLVACIELSPSEAALMDQGVHGAHHQSKASRLQVKAQLSNPGLRSAADLRDRPGIALPGRQAPEQTRRRVFARKTYRNYEGAPVRQEDILRLLAEPERVDTRATPAHRSAEFGLDAIGAVLRHFGQHLSDTRLLPKYGYASPGALYATQLHLEVSGIEGIAPGYYYFHPVEHRLLLIGERADTSAANKGGEPRALVRLHFIGAKRAIEPVYKNNIQEVLEIETGHMLGLFDAVLPEYGLGIDAGRFTPEVLGLLASAPDDLYLGSFDWVAESDGSVDRELDIYVQSHPGKLADLPAGQYLYRDGKLHAISDQLILKKHVIAINQKVYERASFGLSIVSRHSEDWQRYIALGRALQRIQTNDLALGFMASGYSSKSGNDLPSATRLAAILGHCGREAGPCYFALGGGVSQAQIADEGMTEDAVHMKGPAELIKEDLRQRLPDYMLPNRIIVMNALPLTANGKVDLKALQASDQIAVGVDGAGDRPFVAPATATEIEIGEIWKRVMKWDAVSVHDDFFECGGNSLVAVALINGINRAFRRSLPVQALFEAPTIAGLAQRMQASHVEPVSRLVQLAGGHGRPIICWPGLGGYPMNLRELGLAAAQGRPFLGVQAHGLNPDETPHRTIARMAADDIEMIRRLQPKGPYTLWGYSFGARMAFETAYQLEQAGEQVDQLFLIAPGSPTLRAEDGQRHGHEARYDNPAFVTILFSVFAHGISGPALRECLRSVRDEEGFIDFVCERYPHLERSLVARIIGIVKQTYSFEYSFHELVERTLRAPLTIFKAAGDDYSFLESRDGYSQHPPRIVELEADHYSLLKKPQVDELAEKMHALDHDMPGSTIQAAAISFNRDDIMPHLNIKHFPTSMSVENREALIATLTAAVKQAFGCPEHVISIAIEPVEQQEWHERVYVPEILEKRALLYKQPNY